MVKLLDYSFARPDPSRVKAAGYSGVIRYLSHSASKTLTAAERDVLHANGLGIALLWDSSRHRPLTSRNGGYFDGAHANAMASVLDWPKDRPIYTAIDIHTVRDGLKIVANYLGGFEAAIWPHPLGIYGEIEIIEFCARYDTPYLWQTQPWQRVEVSSRARIVQLVDPTGFPDTDLDVIQGPEDTDWGGWFNAPPTRGEVMKGNGCLRSKNTIPTQYR